jgi:hypothetical protein
MYLLPGHPRAFAYNPRPNRTIPPRSFSRARAPFFQYICPQLAVEVSQITHCLLLWLAKPALDPCRYHRACFRGTYKFSEMCAQYVLFILQAAERRTNVARATGHFLCQM